MTSGPIQYEGRTWLAATGANANPWTLGVYAQGKRGRWSELTGRALNVGTGNAQGDLDEAGGKLWAIWVEDVQLQPELFKEQVLVRALAPGAIGRVVRLYSGLSIGPSDMRITAGAGQTWAMYMTTTAEGNLRTTVRPVGP
jgi:hypothetical protein